MPSVTIRRNKFFRGPEPKSHSSASRPTNVCRCSKHCNDPVLNRLVISDFACDLQFGVEITEIFKVAAIKMNKIGRTRNGRHVQIAPMGRQMRAKKCGNIDYAFRTSGKKQSFIIQYMSEWKLDILVARIHFYNLPSAAQFPTSS